MGRCSTGIVILVFFLTAQERDHIVFPHEPHVEEMELECLQCHEGVEESVSLDVRLLPDEESCLECHDGDVATDECSACHANAENPMTYREHPMRTGPPFSHAFHLTQRPDCALCHAHILEDDGLALPTVWEERDCRACHSHVRPDDHGMDWTSIHGSQVSPVTEETCMLCHTQASCDDCHQLQQFETKIHPVSYLLNHGFDARSGVADCSVCHDIRTYCRDCHRQESLMPIDHNLPDWARLPGVRADGGMHAEAALDAPEVCLVCHEPQSSTCLRCHGESGGLGD
ncbi:MAG: cytochrome c3 family protein [Fidelibacterota bacterium]